MWFVIIGSYSSLLPYAPCHYWTNADLPSIGPIGTNVNEIRLITPRLLLKKIHLKMSLAKYSSLCSGLINLAKFNFTSVVLNCKMYDFVELLRKDNSVDDDTTIVISNKCLNYKTSSAVLQWIYQGAMTKPLLRHVASDGIPDIGSDNGWSFSSPGSSSAKTMLM